jgi:MFS family permease
VPTSVLLAVLAAAGLLALAPALVRRYDATERLVAERALSTARVLARVGTQTHRRRRTVPGRRPVNPPRFVVARMTGGVAVGGSASAAASAMELGPASVPAQSDGATPASTRWTTKRAPKRLRHPRAVYRRRRVFAALVLLNLVELAGVVWVDPGFWISAGLTGVLLVAYVVHLRNRTMLEQRRHREEARYAAWVSARQAAVRREQARRAAARRELLREQLLEREQARREAARAAAQGAVRGRAYEARAVGQDW